MRLNPPDYVALIEREDVDTVYQHRHLELLVDPSAVDRILALGSILEALRFTVSRGKIVDVTKA